MYVANYLLRPILYDFVKAFLDRIAAANIEIEGTDVSALTLHALFDLDGELQSRLDIAKFDCEKVKQLMSLDVLLLDEVSMMDTEAWNAIAGIMSTIDHSRRPQGSKEPDDPFGALHVLLFGDFKQTVE